jgi:hypothetical protein
MSGGVRKRARELTTKLTSDPFFPLLFLSEAVKNGTFHALAGSPSLDVVGASVGMAAVSVVGWLYTSDDVAWGLQKAAEAVDEVTDE